MRKKNNAKAWSEIKKHTQYPGLAGGKHLEGRDENS